MNNQPRHIAVIMDGNGRWAAKRLLPRAVGHSKGLQAARNVVKLCINSNIEILSLFAFSTENWSRPKAEVKVLMDLLFKVFTEEISNLHQNQVKINVIGDLDALSDKLKLVIQNAINLTKDNQGLKLNIAISYGGRWDLIQALKKIIFDLQQENFKLNDLNEHTLAKYLSLKELPDPDLVIRTSGEQRLSNFFLWQTAYSELWFTEVLWPDFGELEFQAALNFYANRTRKFGKIIDANNIDRKHIMVGEK